MPCALSTRSPRTTREFIRGRASRQFWYHRHGPPRIRGERSFVDVQRQGCLDVNRHRQVQHPRLAARYALQHSQPPRHRPRDQPAPEVDRRSISLDELEQRAITKYKAMTDHR